MSLEIHWHEGLFLQPHHLQRMQRNLSTRVADERRLVMPFPYGVIDARLSRDELENKRVRFERLRVVMPSGLEVNYPDNAELPSLDIAQSFAKGSGTFTICLAVPLWQTARANTVSQDPSADTRAKLIFRVSEMDCVDENTGDNGKPLHVRKLNARLILDQEDPSDLEVLPVVRITRATGEDVGLPKEEPEYVPPCLVLNGSRVLRELVRDLVNQVEASRKELVVQLTRGGFSLDTLRGVQFEQMMRLRTLNRFSGSLPALVQANGVTPFAVYLQLRELLGELAALHPDRDEFSCAEYSHDNPFVCFEELSEKIRSHLRGAVAPSYLKVAFADSAGYLTVALNEEHLAASNSFFLGIKTKVDPTALARFVVDPDRFKLMPRSLVTRAIRGVELKEERHAPMELPASSDMFYFRLDRGASARMWQQIESEKQAALWWAGSDLDWSDTSFTLYMTVPNK